MKVKLPALLTWVLAVRMQVGQATGNLEIHFMDVGQGDGALLISPEGETVLFDSGVRNQHHRPISYLQQLGVTNIHYHIASHYHGHIGAVVNVLDRFPLVKQAIDRDGSYHTRTFTNYVNFVGDKRTAAIEGSSITLDAGSEHQVRVEFVAMNGNGVAAARDENDLSLVCVVRFGQFDAVFARGSQWGEGVEVSGHRDFSGPAGRTSRGVQGQPPWEPSQFQRELAARNRAQSGDHFMRDEQQPRASA